MEKSTVNHTRHIFDTSFLLLAARRAPYLQNELEPLIIAGQLQTILPLAVYAELNKLQERNDPQLSHEAKQAKAFLRRLQLKELLELGGETGDDFGDGVFRYACAHLQLTFDLIVLTQDVGLMHDLLSLNSSESVTKQLHEISIKSLDEQSGILRDVGIDEVRRRLARRAEVAAGIPRPRIANSQRNRQRTPNVKYVPTRELKPILTNVEIPPVEAPQTGEMVYAGKFGQFRLGKEIARGGEGRIYVGPSDVHVAKIYRPGKMSVGKVAKLDLMINNGLDWKHPCAPNFAWPLEKVIDGEGQCVGFLMKRVDGEILANTIFIGRQLKSRFPDWDRTHLVRVCIAIVERIRFMHDSNVVVGDINPQNILVRSQNDVSFIDTDSYQIEGHPCPVGTVRFTAPEVMGKPYGSYVLTKDHEVFSVATLLFMILHAGKPPYAQAGGSTPMDNIKSGNFPYAFNGSGGRDVPEGPWKYIWSNLSVKMKDAFYKTFAAKHRGELRIPLDLWQDYLERYLYHIENRCAPDDQRRALFPASNIKGNIYFKQMACVECGREFSVSEVDLEKRAQNGAAIPSVCAACVAQVAENARRKREDERRSTEALEDLKRSIEKLRTSRVQNVLRCKNCGRSFNFTVGEAEFYAKNNFAMPIRCEACRKLKNRR